MKSISSYLTFPLILGLSLTGVGVGFFYFLYKKDEEKDESRSISLRETKFISSEVKIPRQFVPVIIGRQGITIKDIESRTSTRIRFSAENPEIPERVCFIKGTYETIKLAEAMIHSIIANQPIIENYEMFIPQRVLMSLLENRGELIHKIQSSSNTKIILDKGRYNNNPEEQRRVIVKGTAEQIAEAVSYIEEMVRDANSELKKLRAGQITRSPRGRPNLRSSENNNFVEIHDKKQPIESPIAQEGVMEVYVSAVDSPSQFWVQVVGTGTIALDELVDNMTAYYNNEESREVHELKNIQVGQTVAAKFSYDNCWYRAEVSGVKENSLYEVYFLDYGDHEILNATNLLELRTDFLSLRLQAIECCLANVKPKDEEWSQEVCDRFSDLTWVAQWKILTAKVRGYKERVIGQGKSRREGSPIPCVDLFDRNDNQEIDIGKQFVAENLAIPEDMSWSATSSTLSLSKRSNDFSTSTRMSHKSAQNLSVATISSAETSPSQRHEPAPELIDISTPPRVLNKPQVIAEIDLVTPKNERVAKFDDTTINKGKNGNGDRVNRSAPNVMADIDSDGAESDASDALEMF